MAEVLAKKGISPLVATVLLVAFSVALGAVVMSWGEEYVEEKAEFVQGVREAVSNCDAASFTLLRLEGLPQICYKQGSLEMTIDNGPDAEIYDFSARIVGVVGTYTAETVLGAPLKKLYAVKAAVPFPKTIGGVQQVKLVPKTKSGNDLVFCKSQSLTVERIMPCQ